jgi:hypothetical protein
VDPLEKIDLKKEHKDLYNPPAKEIAIVEVPKMNFLMVDGSGDPNTSQEYKDAVEALFSLSYTLKFMIKKAKAVDYAVMPLEGLWWSDDMSKFAEDKNLWKWTAMIIQPEQVTKDSVAKAIEELNKKKQLPALSKIRFESFHEGTAAQIMYFGPFSDEGPTIQKIHEFIRKNEGTLTGKHHEIYLSDPRRVTPEKLKTVLRQPMKRK